MANPPWFDALLEACYHAHDPALHYESAEGILASHLREWEVSPTPLDFRFPLPASFSYTYETCSIEEIFVLLQRAVREGGEDDRAFALILLGALATPEALDLVRSFLTSPSLKERWASTIALGRHKDERVFSLVQNLLLDGFLVSRSSTSEEETESQERAQDAYPLISDAAADHKYEWYMHQRWECALVLGAWGDPCVVPLLKEALQAAWKMEQMWPDYGGFQDGPQIWHAFQDRLVFALGQLGAWDILRELDLPENRKVWYAFQDRLVFALSHVGAWDVLRKLDLPANRMLIATIYLALGALQVRDSSIFYQPQHLFALPHHIQPSPSSLERILARFPVEKQEQAKRLLANQVDFHERWLSEHADQESLLAQLPAEKQKRIKRVIAGHAEMKARWLAENPYVEPARVKQLLARHLGFSETEQEYFLRRFPEALLERDKESNLAAQWYWRGQPDTFDSPDMSDTFDPFLDADDLPQF